MPWSLLRTGTQTPIYLKRLESIDENAIVGCLKPLLGLLLGDLLLLAKTGTAVLALGDAATWAGEDNVKIHTVNTGAGVILNAKIDVLRDAESEVSGVAEVHRLELELFHTKTALDEFQCLFPTDSHMACDLLVTADTKLADGVARSGEDRLLACELLEHLGGTCKPIPGLADGAVDDELLHVDAPLPCFTLFSGHDGQGYDVVLLLLLLSEPPQ